MANKEPIERPRAASTFGSSRLNESQSAFVIEIQHRLRNALAVVRSIARRTAETSETVEEYSANFEGRLNAYARTLSLLTTDANDGVALDFLVAEELLSVQAHDGRQANVEGPAVQLRRKTAETVGLALHELATNALKHGSLGHPDGKVDVSWRVIDGSFGRRQLQLDWRESGGRRLMAVPRRRGFGIVMLEKTLAFDLGAQTELSFESTGFRCRIILPVNDDIFVLDGDH